MCWCCKKILHLHAACESPRPGKIQQGHLSITCGYRNKGMWVNRLRSFYQFLAHFKAGYYILHDLNVYLTLRDIQMKCVVWLKPFDLRFTILHHVVAILIFRSLLCNIVCNNIQVSRVIKEIDTIGNHASLYLASLYRIMYIQKTG